MKMIALDLDSTLLRTDKTISGYTEKVLEACRQQGIIVAFATARSECDCTNYIAQINPDAIISNRGALVKVGEHIISRSTIDIETTNKILASCLAQASVRYITVFTDKGYYINIPADEYDLTWGEYNPDLYTDFSSKLEHDAYKISIEIFDDEAANALALSLPEVDVVRFSGENWFSFGINAVNKFEGVKSLAQYFGIELNEVAAFGDDYSDIEMLQGCGFGVAVENAISEVLAVADYVCGSNDCDGVAKWIEAKFFDEKAQC